MRNWLMLGSNFQFAPFSLDTIGPLFSPDDKGNIQLLAISSRTFTTQAMRAQQLSVISGEDNGFDFDFLARGSRRFPQIKTRICVICGQTFDNRGSAVSAVIRT